MPFSLTILFGLNAFAVLFAKLPMTFCVIYNCEPLIASVEVAEILPAATLMILRSSPSAPTLTKRPVSFTFPTKSPYLILLTVAFVTFAMV